MGVTSHIPEACNLMYTLYPITSGSYDLASPSAMMFPEP